MGKRIGNVGTLNLIDATEESVKDIDFIGNIGSVIYRKETAHLFTSLNIGNVGQTIEIPEGYKYVKGPLTIDPDFLNSLTGELKLFVSGDVVIDEAVESFEHSLKLVVQGNVYCPKALTGAVHSLFPKESPLLKSYENTALRFEKGRFQLTNAYLETLEKTVTLVVRGELFFAQDLDPVLFSEKVEEINAKGLIKLYQSQEALLYKKTDSLGKCKVSVIPDGYQVVNDSIRLNARSIRRFKQAKLFTESPVLFDKGVTREQLNHAIDSIQSDSLIVCHEEIEDLIYEKTVQLDTEVIAYENDFVLIEDDQMWTNAQLEALEQPYHFIVEGQLRIDEDVKNTVLKEKVTAIDNLGEILTADQRMKGILQNILQTNEGIVRVEEDREESIGLGNLGQLTL